MSVSTRRARSRTLFHSVEFGKFHVVLNHILLRVNTLMIITLFLLLLLKPILSDRVSNAQNSFRSFIFVLNVLISFSFLSGWMIFYSECECLKFFVLNKIRCIVSILKHYPYYFSWKPTNIYACTMHIQ